MVSQLDPDVLLIDEVLAVGDTAFQEKCMRRMDALRRSDKAIVFVTHSLYQVEALCDSALWLEEGRVREYGPAGDVVRAYLDEQEKKAMLASADEGVTYEGRGTAATRAFFDSRDANADRGPTRAASDHAMILESVSCWLRVASPALNCRSSPSAPSASGTTAHGRFTSRCSTCASIWGISASLRPAC